jgi:hypothetical protein
MSFNLIEQAKQPYQSIQPTKGIPEPNVLPLVAAAIELAVEDLKANPKLGTHPYVPDNIDDLRESAELFLEESLIMDLVMDIVDWDGPKHELIDKLVSNPHS